MSDLDLLIEPDWLEASLGDEGVRIIDASWYLPSEQRDARAEYAAGHIPGASYLDLSTDLADPTSLLRNAVLDPEQLAHAFGRAGIGSEHRVVVYDRRGGYSSGRIWWTLRYAGHQRVGLLDGGFARWEREGRPVATEVPRLSAVPFEAKPEPRWLRRKEDVLAVVENGGAVIVDARSAARFRGEGPESARRAGHIPGSVNLPWSENLERDPPTLRDRGALRRAYEARGVRFDLPVITTCGSGVTAALNAFVLTLIGHADVSVYDGSWDEWGNAEDTPIEPG